MKIVVITDCAFGLPFFDQDDALALWFLFERKDTEVVGIITSHGNVSEPKAFRATHKLLKALNKKAKVVRQKAGKKFLINTLTSFPAQVTVLSLAPLTVISEALKVKPGLSRLWKRLVVMGGTGGAKPTGWPFVNEELNFRKDKEAAVHVLTEAYPVLVTLKETRRHTWGLKEILALPNDLQKHVRLWFWLNRLSGKRGFSPHDLVAAEVALKGV